MQQLYGPGYSSEHSSEVYGPKDAMITDSKNFIRVKDLDEDKQEYIAPIKSGLILDGGGRTRWAEGIMSYGRRIHERNGNKPSNIRLFKNTDGRCHYDVHIKDHEWKNTHDFTFNESSLTWSKVNISS